MFRTQQDVVTADPPVSGVRTRLRNLAGVMLETRPADKSAAERMIGRQHGQHCIRPGPPNSGTDTSRFPPSCRDVGPGGAPFPRPCSISDMAGAGLPDPCRGCEPAGAPLIPRGRRANTSGTRLILACSDCNMAGSSRVMGLQVLLSVLSQPSRGHTGFPASTILEPPGRSWPL
jgi:hypothetical protein